MRKNPRKRICKSKNPSYLRWEDYGGRHNSFTVLCLKIVIRGDKHFLLLILSLNTKHSGQKAFTFLNIMQRIQVNNYW